MRHWNYRVIAIEKDGQETYGVYDVLFDDKGNPDVHSYKPVTLCSNGKKGLKDMIKAIKQAHALPVLRVNQFMYEKQ